MDMRELRRRLWETEEQLEIEQMKLQRECEALEAANGRRPPQHGRPAQTGQRRDAQARQARPQRRDGSGQMSQDAHQKDQYNDEARDVLMPLHYPGEGNGGRREDPQSLEEPRTREDTQNFLAKIADLEREKEHIMMKLDEAMTVNQALEASLSAQRALGEEFGEAQFSENQRATRLESELQAERGTLSKERQQSAQLLNDAERVIISLQEEKDRLLSLLDQQKLRDKVDSAATSETTTPLATSIAAPANPQQSTQSSMTTQTSNERIPPPNDKIPPVIAHVASLHAIESQKHQAIIAVAEQVTATTTGTGSPRLTASCGIYANYTNPSPRSTIYAPAMSARSNTSDRPRVSRRSSAESNQEDRDHEGSYMLLPQSTAGSPPGSCTSSYRSMLMQPGRSSSTQSMFGVPQMLSPPTVHRQVITTESFRPFGDVIPEVVTTDILRARARPLSPVEQSKRTPSPDVGGSQVSSIEFPVQRHPSPVEPRRLTPPRVIRTEMLKPTIILATSSERRHPSPVEPRTLPRTVSPAEMINIPGPAVFCEAPVDSALMALGPALLQFGATTPGQPIRTSSRSPPPQSRLLTSPQIMTDRRSVGPEMAMTSRCTACGSMRVSSPVGIVHHDAHRCITPLTPRPSSGAVRSLTPVPSTGTFRSCVFCPAPAVATTCLQPCWSSSIVRSASATRMSF